MADTEAAAISIAEAYAQALLQAASGQGRPDDVRQEFGDLLEYMDRDGDFAAFLTSETVDVDARRATLERIFRGRMDDLLLNALLVLNDKRRLHIVRQVHGRYEVLLRRWRGQREVLVISAIPLDLHLRERLERALTGYTGQQVVLVEQVDSGILGGVILQIGDQRIDASVLRDLQRRRERIRQRAGEEIRSGKSYFDDAA